MAELLYVISSQSTKFIRADKFLLSMPLQHKPANRYRQFPTMSINKIHIFLTVTLVMFFGCKNAPEKIITDQEKWNRLTIGFKNLEVCKLPCFSDHSKVEFLLKFPTINQQEI